MVAMKLDTRYTISPIAHGGAYEALLDDKTFSGQSLFRVELNLPQGSDQWVGIHIAPEAILYDINGAIRISFDLIYKWRQPLKDAWMIDTRRGGKRPADMDAIKRFAQFSEKTVEAFIAENNIDLAKPDRPARTGAGQPFYAELVADNQVLDAYNLGDSEDLGLDDNDALGFYGKKQVAFYVQDCSKTSVSKLAVNLYIGAPGATYTGSLWFGNCTVDTVTPDAFPPELITEPVAPPHVLKVGEVGVSPIDKDLIPVAVDALGYLKGAAESGHILFGTQNYPYSKGGRGYKDAPQRTSDVFDLMGADPAIFGFDSLSLIGLENAFAMPDIQLVGDHISDPANIPLFIQGSALRSLEAWKAGAIPTLSLHMSDPGMVYDHYKKDNTNPATGRSIFNEGAKYPWNFYGYGYGNSTRTAHDPRDNRARSPHNTMLRMYRAITGQSTDAYDVGALEVFNAYMDIVADYCLLMQAQNIPILFRPFHENSGDWFWWGNSGCENEDHTYNPDLFIQSWQYTAQYMLKRGVHNCIYVYSPNGSDFDNTEKMYTHAFRPYALTYPGDEWVDICAYDDYTTDEATMRSDIEYVTRFAAEHGKLAAGSEVTGSPVDPAITEYLFRTLTDTAHLPVNLAYFLQWTPPSYAPFLVSPSRANAGAVNTFIRTLGNEKVVLSNETDGFKPAKAVVVQ